jgi:hypothetical protein
LKLALLSEEQVRRLTDEALVSAYAGAIKNTLERELGETPEDTNDKQAYRTLVRSILLERTQDEPIVTLWEQAVISANVRAYRDTSEKLRARQGRCTAARKTLLDHLAVARRNL